MAQIKESLVARLEAAAAKLGGGAVEDADGKPAFVSGWDEFYGSSVQPFIDTSNKLNDTKYIAEMAEKSFKHVGVAMNMAADTKKPKQEEFLAFLDPVIQVMQGSEAKVDNRSPAFGFQKAFAEVSQAHSWLVMDLPAPHIAGQLDAADFYLNKVLKDAKEKAGDEQKNMRDWVAQIKTLVKNYSEYVKNFHKTGVTWNFKGGEIKGWAPGAKKGGGGGGAASLEDRLEAAVKAIEAAANKRGGGDDEKDGQPASVTAYDEFYAKSVQPFVDTCNKINDAKYIADFAEKSFKHVGVAMRAASVSKKPKPEDFLKFLDPVVQIIQGSEGKVDNRSPAFGFQKSWAEVSQAHSWLMMDLPAPHIAGQLDAADFYLNKVLKDAKEKAGDEQTNFRDYVARIKALVKEYSAYVKEFHKTGPTWNPKGAELSAYKP